MAEVFEMWIILVCILVGLFVLSYLYQKEQKLDYVDRVVFAIVFAESGWDQYALGDYRPNDYYGGGFTSVGLGQISTYKETADQWSTFDYIVNHYPLRFPNLQSQETRDQEVRKARRGETDSALFDAQINLELTRSYIEKIVNTHNIVDLGSWHTLLVIAKYYNAGINTTLSQQEWEETHKEYIVRLRVGWDLYEL